jgi:hypothetical protein
MKGKGLISCGAMTQIGFYELFILDVEQNRARIFKLLSGPRIDPKEPIPPGCVAWRAGTTTLFLFGS